MPEKACGFKSHLAHQNIVDYKLLKNLPSPFYRVSVKAIILDDQNRLLIGKGEEGDEGWEIPGGGLEHNESLEECLSREIEEELGVNVQKVGRISFVYRGRSVRGWMILRIAVLVELKDFNFKYGDMTEGKFITKDELKSINFAADEGTIKDCADLIWPK